MKPQNLFLSAVICTTALFAVISTALAEIPAEVSEPLEAMAAKLTGAGTVELTAKRSLNAELAEAQGLPEQVMVQVFAERPAKFHAKSSGEDFPGRSIVFDGETLLLHDMGEKVYATAELKGDIGDMLRTAEEKFGFTPPIGAMFAPDLEQRLLKVEGQSGEVVGVEEGTVHLKFTGAAVDWEIWIDINSHLPVKFLVKAGEDQIIVEEMVWNLSPDFADDAFSTGAPEGAEKIEMLTEEEIEASLKSD